MYMCWFDQSWIAYSNQNESNKKLGTNDIFHFPWFDLIKKNISIKSLLILENKKKKFLHKLYLLITNPKE